MRVSRYSAPAIVVCLALFGGALLVCGGCSNESASKEAPQSIDIEEQTLLEEGIQKGIEKGAPKGAR